MIGEQEKKTKEQNSEVRKWTTWLTYITSCTKNSLGRENLRGGWYYDSAKQLSYYLYFFFFLFLLLFTI